MHGQKLSLSR